MLSDVLYEWQFCDHWRRRSRSTVNWTEIAEPRQAQTVKHVLMSIFI